MEKHDTVADCIARMSARLAPITDTPRLEAEMLLAHALGVSRASLLARLREPVDARAAARLLARRLDHEPLAYIFGEWEFFGLSFLVPPPLLTPRPETEHLVEAALKYLAVGRAASPDCPRVADLCCGVGCVAVSIGKHRADASLCACDVRADAVETTLRNAARHRVRIHCVQGDLFAPLDNVCDCFDVVVSNPPYVPAGEWQDLAPVITKHEDPGALLAGKDGLEVIRRIIPAAFSRLRIGGMLAMELGDGQFPAAAALMRKQGFAQVAAVRDLSGTD
ncbi:MAG TPA: peptide chain release factor N(5)-glutamine methyltransferase, partial [Candidatus Hydrogenedentes bacterium]|nr:peptide chain release factor N(5)-glutamine methyltransferase [Candidatus Hydrogenedentota bacterium]